MHEAVDFRRMDLPAAEHEQHPDGDGRPAGPPAVSQPDLERIAGDLADIERALDRLDDGSYWTDEVTGEPIPDDLHAHDPAARRVAGLPTDPLDAGGGSSDG